MVAFHKRRYFAKNRKLFIWLSSALYAFLILISDQFHEKIRRQALADQGKRPQARCRLARAFDDEQRVNDGEDFHGFGQRLV